MSDGGQATLLALMLAAFAILAFVAVAHENRRCARIRALKGKIEDLLEEIERMARRDLTAEQLKAFLDGDCRECPRCGDDGFTVEDVGNDDDDRVVQVYACDECGEKLRVVYRAVEVESANDE